MKRVCAWCGTVLEDSSDPQAEISHGICESCAVFFLSTKAEATLGSFLNRLPYPVMVVDDDVMVLDGNAAGLELAGKDREDVVGRLSGDVVECAHSRLPGGCGRTEHCGACVIRKCAGATFSSGIPMTDEPCTLLRLVDGMEKLTDFFVSTRKVGNAVLLKLDPRG